MEQPEYEAIDKRNEQPVSPKGPPRKTENVNGSPDQEYQKLHQSKEGPHVYAQLDQSKKELPPQVFNGTENMNSSQNDESQKPSPSEEVRHVYPQPDLSKKN